MSRRRLLLLLAVMVSAAFALLLNARTSLVHGALVDQAEQLGLVDFSAEVSTLGLGRAELENLHFDLGSSEAEFTVSKVTVHYTAAALAESRINRVDIDGLVVKSDLRSEEGESDSGPTLDGELASSASTVTPEVNGIAASVGSLVLPFDVLNLSDAALALLTDFGEMLVRGDMHVAKTNDGALDVKLDLHVTGDAPQLAASAELTGRLENDGSLALSPIGCISLELPETWFEDPLHLSPRQPLCLRGGEGSALQIERVTSVPMLRTVRTVLDPLTFTGRFGDDPSELPLRLSLPPLHLVFEVSSAASMEDPTFSFRVMGAGGGVELPEYDVAFRDIDFDLQSTSAKQVDRFDLSRSMLVDLATPARFAPISVRGEMKVAADEHLDVVMQFGESDQPATVLVNARVTSDLELRDADLAFATIDLSTQSAGLIEQLPVLRELPNGLVGVVALKGRARLQDGAVETQLKASLDAIGFEADWGKVSGITAELDVFAAPEFFTKATQRVVIQELSTGLDLRNGLVDFDLRRDGTIDIVNMEWEFAGGLATSRGSYTPGAPEHTFTLALSGIDLQQVLELLDVEGLSGKGTLAGEFPVFVKGDVMEFRDAKLVSTSQGGLFRYKPSAATSAIAAQNEQIGLLTQVFEDFHFETIVIALNGDVFGDVQASIHLGGANPSFNNGVPIEFNLNVGAQFGDLIRGGSAGFEFTDRVVDEMRDKNQARKAK